MTISVLREIQRWVCPFCGHSMGTGYEPSQWSCCGEVGRAIPEDDYEGQEAAKGTNVHQI